MTDRVTNFIDLETAAKQFQDAIIFAYNENCPSTVRWNNRNIPWWNKDLAERRSKVRRLFNAVKKSGNWTDYKRTLTDYNKALRQAKRESWRRHCEEKETLEELLWVHLLGSEISLEPPGGWDSLELEHPKWKGYREDWEVSRRVINYDKLKWAVFSFQP
jgi:transposase